MYIYNMVPPKDLPVSCVCDSFAKQGLRLSEAIRCVYIPGFAIWAGEGGSLQRERKNEIWRKSSFFGDFSMILRKSIFCKTAFF